MVIDSKTEETDVEMSPNSPEPLQENQKRKAIGLSLQRTFWSVALSTQHLPGWFD